MAPPDIKQFIKYLKQPKNMISEKIAQMIPIKRLAETSELVGIVAYLCSDLNTYLTGQNIVVDGGYTAQ